LVEVTNHCFTFKGFGFVSRKEGKGLGIVATVLNEGAKKQKLRILKAKVKLDT